MKKTSDFRVWSIVYPLFLYWAVVVLAMMLAQMAIGTDDAHYMICQIIASALAGLVVYFSFYGPDHKLFPDIPYERGKLIGLVVLLAIASILVGISLNNMILLSPLARVSAGYAEASSEFYGGALIFQVLGAGLLVPAVEELIYRGVIFGRLRRMMGFVPAMLLSAFVFAILHFNLVQFTYALLCGLMLAFVVELTGRVWASMLCHMAINLVSVFRTNHDLLGSMMEQSLSSWLLNIGLLLIGIGILQFAKDRSNKMKKEQ